jgi:SAM-dependent methyltransferase
VLDFGCGRLTRHSPVDARHKGVACDLNSDHVAWCRENIRGFHVNAPMPPLSFEDSSIDFAYLHSIFTNLPVAATLAWFADLARIIRPGGIVAIAAHRYSAIDTSIGSVLHDKKFGLDFPSASVLRIDLES